MSQRISIGRRTFLKGAGAAAVTVGAGMGARLLVPGAGAPAARLTASYSGLKVKRYHIGATDGWVSMPVQTKAIAPFFPDPMAPDYTEKHGYYVMGFRDLSPDPRHPELPQYEGGLDTGIFPMTGAITAQKNRAQIAAPILFARVGEDLRFHLDNLGLANRPDLSDSHTIHFHGFPNQTAYFDGVPDASLAATVGRSLIYRYIPQDPGTYMWHCHFEDVEHVHMGLTGICFILPAMGPNYAYDDAATKFDRQFAFLLTESDVKDHYADAHLQINDFSQWSASFRLMNGRAWPDTVLPNVDPQDGTWKDGPNAGTNAPIGGVAGNNPTRLQYNPLTSLIQANSGDRVLVRISNLGYEEHSLVMPGIQFRVIGRDAKPLTDKRPDYLANVPANGAAYAAGTRGDISWLTDRVDLGPGESRDLLFTAPNVSKKTVFAFYDRNDAFLGNSGSGAAGDGYGGMRTEVHVFPAGKLAPQPQGSTMDFATTGKQWVPNQLFTDGSGGY